MTTRSRPPACAVCEDHAEAVFRVEGLHCSDEVAILERRLKPLPGVETLAADVVSQRLRVAYDAARLGPAAMVDAAADAGLRMWLEHEAPAGDARSELWRAGMMLGSGAALGVGQAHQRRRVQAGVGDGQAGDTRQAAGQELVVARELARRVPGDEQRPQHGGRRIDRSRRRVLQPHAEHRPGADAPPHALR